MPRWKNRDEIWPQAQINKSEAYNYLATQIFTYVSWIQIIRSYNFKPKYSELLRNVWILKNLKDLYFLQRRNKQNKKGFLYPFHIFCFETSTFVRQIIFIIVHAFQMKIYQSIATTSKSIKNWVSDVQRDYPWKLFKRSKFIYWCVKLLICIPYPRANRNNCVSLSVCLSIQYIFIIKGYVFL